MKTKIDKDINICMIKIKVVLTLSLFKKVDIVMDNTDNYIVEILEKWAKEKNIVFSVETRPATIYIKGHHFLRVLYSERHCNILHLKK